MSKTKHRGPGIYLELDPTDPDTPAMVYSSRSVCYSATFGCATCEGELSGRDGTIPLTDDQLTWLSQFEEQVDEAYYQARKDRPEYR